MQSVQLSEEQLTRIIGALEAYMDTPTKGLKDYLRVVRDRGPKKPGQVECGCHPGLYCHVECND